MAKYVKKSEMVEAKQYELGMEDGFLWKNKEMGLLHYLKSNNWRQPKGICGVPYIQSTEKKIIISEGDYIITNSKGDKTILSKETFEKEYEMVATYAPIVEYPRNSEEDTINSKLDKALFFLQFPKVTYKTYPTPEIKFRTFHVIVEGFDDVSSYEQEIGRITVAYQIINDNEYKCAFSFCSYRDKYSKKEGQRIAEERINSIKQRHHIVNGFNIESLKRRAMEDVRYRNIYWMKGITVDNLK